MTWRKRLLNWLCLIYQILGGDCADLGVDPDQFIKTAQDYFDANGLPTFSSSAKRDEFVAALDGLENCLADAGNDLSAATNAKFAAFIADIRAALAANP